MSTYCQTSLRHTKLVPGSSSYQGTILHVQYYSKPNRAWKLVCAKQKFCLSSVLLTEMPQCLLSRSTYYPGVLTIQEYLLLRSTYYPGVLTNQEYLLSRSTYYPGVLTNPGTYYSGVLTIQEYLLTRITY